MMRGVLTAPLLVGASLMSANIPKTTVVTPGVGFVVTSYRLALTPNIPAKTIAGRATITLRATIDGVRRLNFTANAPTIDGASLVGVSLVHSVRGDVLGFDLPRPLRRGRSMSLRISYHGRPARGFAGSATTLYTSYFACAWIICSQNKFGKKAAYSLDLTVPAGMTSLSVCSMIAKRRGPDGSEIHRWQAPRPYSAYLYGFAVGPFMRIDEKAGSGRLPYLSDIVSAGELRRRFADTKDMVAFLSDKAGLQLPVDEYS